jgi:hypothetical protein
MIFIKSKPDITVIDVFRDLDLEPIPEDTWAAGNAARDLYEATTGHLPPKALRPKTNESGSHCFAVYPASWREELEEIVKLVARRRASQLRLF